MRQVSLSPKALAGFLVFLLAFALLIGFDHGSGPISRTWPSLMLIAVLGATVAIYLRLWRARTDAEQFKRAEAQGLYGVLPEKFRNWLFP